MRQCAASEMSRENVELVKALQPTGVDLVEVFTDENAGDSPLVTGSSELFEHDFEVSWIASDEQRLDYRGVEGLVAGWQDWLTPWKSYWMDSEEFFDAGDDVVAFVRVEAKTTRDDVLVRHTPAAVWSIRGGKIAAIRFYLERDAALRAAGLQEVTTAERSERDPSG